MTSPIPALIALAWLSLAGVLLIDDVQRLWRWGATRLGPTARRSRALGDYYALILTFIVATICVPIVKSIPSVWLTLSHRPQFQVDLVAPIIAMWLCVCIAGRWSLRAGLTTPGRTIWWVLLALASLGWPRGWTAVVQGSG